MSSGPTSQSESANPGSVQPGDSQKKRPPSLSECSIKIAHPADAYGLAQFAKKKDLYLHPSGNDFQRTGPRLELLLNWFWYGANNPEYLILKATDTHDVIVGFLHMSLNTVPDHMNDGRKHLCWPSSGYVHNSRNKHPVKSPCEAIALLDESMKWDIELSWMFINHLVYSEGLPNETEFTDVGNALLLTAVKISALLDRHVFIIEERDLWEYREGQGFTFITPQDGRPVLSRETLERMAFADRAPMIFHHRSDSDSPTSSSGQSDSSENRVVKYDWNLHRTQHYGLRCADNLLPLRKHLTSQHVYRATHANYDEHDLCRVIVEYGCLAYSPAIKGAAEMGLGAYARVMVEPDPSSLSDHEIEVVPTPKTPEFKLENEPENEP